MSIIDDVKQLAKTGFRAPPSKKAEEQTSGEPAPQASKKPEEEDVFEDLWEPPKEGDAVAPPPVTISGALTQEKLQALAESQDFSSLIPKETADGLTPEQVTAVAKDVYIKALQHSGTLADGLVAAKAKELEATVANKVKDELVKAATQKQTATLPKSADPLVELVRQQIQSRHQGAPAEWVAEQTTKYIKDVAAGINKSVEESVGAPSGVPGRRPGNPPFPPGAQVQNRENPKNWMEWLAQD